MVEMGSNYQIATLCIPQKSIVADNCKVRGYPGENAP